MSYQSVEDFLPLAMKQAAAHRERSRLFHSRGTLLMAGPVEEPMNGDAIVVIERCDVGRTLPGCRDAHAARASPMLQQGPRAHDVSIVRRRPRGT
jgi:hypothetical protein